MLTHIQQSEYLGHEEFYFIFLINISPLGLVSTPGINIIVIKILWLSAVYNALSVFELDQGVKLHIMYYEGIDFVWGESKPKLFPSSFIWALLVL